MDRRRRRGSAGSAAGLRAAARERHDRKRHARRRRGRGRARAAPRRRARGDAAPDRRRLAIPMSAQAAASAASLPGEGLVEARRLHWRERASEATLRRDGRRWTLWTVGILIIFGAPAALV